MRKITVSCMMMGMYMFDMCMMMCAKKADSPCVLSV